MTLVGNRSKDPDKKTPGQKPPGHKLPDNKPPRIIEEIIAKYAVDTKLFRLGSTNPKKKAPGCFFGVPTSKNPTAKYSRATHYINIYICICVYRFI